MSAFQRPVLFQAVVVVSSLVVNSCTFQQRDDSRVPAVERRDELTLERVAALVRESPDDFVAGVQEVVDDSKCYGPADGSSCRLTVRITDFIAGNPGRLDQRREGWTYQTVEMRMEKPWPNRLIGRKRLVLACPTQRPELYGNRLFILDPTEADVRALRQIFTALQL